MGEEFEEAETVVDAATDVEDLASNGGFIFVSGVVESDEIVGVEDVADLFSGARDGEGFGGFAGVEGGFLLESFLAEPTDPALVVGRELASTVDRGMAEDDGSDAVVAVPVADVLVGGAFGAAIGGSEVEGDGFVEAVGVLGGVITGRSLF